MKETLLHSLLELAHATSQNLGFAHQDDVHVSYGEETITETNLLELRRRHPAIITLNTFGKKKESTIGADWEWHIIGRAREFRMRVQAKRLQKDDKLKIPHKVKSSGKQQIDLLIADAKKNSLKPVYCIYSAEKQRNCWKKRTGIIGNLDMYEAGCLLVDAETVKAKMPRTLGEIENDCVPWHYLVEHSDFGETRLSQPMTGAGTLMKSAVPALHLPVVPAKDRPVDPIASRSLPTIDELNAKKRPIRKIEGLVEATEPEFSRRRSGGEYQERGIVRLVEINVQEFPDLQQSMDESDE